MIIIGNGKIEIKSDKEILREAKEKPPVIWNQTESTTAYGASCRQRDADRKWFTEFLERNKVLLQPREGWVTFMIKEKEWRELTEAQDGH